MNTRPMTRDQLLGDIECGQLSILFEVSLRSSEDRYLVASGKLLLVCNRVNGQKELTQMVAAELGHVLR